MTETYCLERTRTVSLPQKCFDTSIKLNKQDDVNGLRVTANTLGFKNRERRHIRVTNTYVFGDRKIVVVWNNVVKMVQLPSVSGKMNMYPKLSEIWVTVGGNPINGSLPAEMISKMKREINDIIGDRYVVIDNIELDQFEMLRNNNVFRLPDMILEKLLIYADLRTIASREMIQFSREVPDDIELLVSIEQVYGTQTEAVKPLFEF
ncbi:hypothetical protein YASMINEVIRUS_856 [Yasminevirus sp. GU-2018]|uniref:Uncharacterized protein n=1 Tax=Yasminevirus sp. GU-2018 TaxID=2420051 RepID=A0A5K0UAC2_9VIRU|nr:hypothetical protein YASMINEVIRUS_856 [Yasminevirus sp. GU-2018]